MIGNRKVTLTISAVLASLLLGAVACGSGPETESAAPAAPGAPAATAPPATPEVPQATPELPADAPVSQPGSVSGSVSYGDGVAPGPDAVATIKLQDTSRMDAPAAQDVLCMTTAMVSLPIEFEFGKDHVPTGFDG